MTSSCDMSERVAQKANPPRVSGPRRVLTSPTCKEVEMATYRVCTIDGCCKPVVARGWCATHWARWRKYRNPTFPDQRITKKKKCSLYGCADIVHARGYCRSHYSQWRAHGDPNIRKKHKNGAVRRWIKDFAAPHVGTECLIWPFARCANGYGNFWDGEKHTSAHRAVCIEVYGDPPTVNSEAAHLCGKGHEGCVNPVHLKWSEKAENELHKVGHGTLCLGSSVGTAKLSASEVLEIRAMSGVDTHRAIAKRFGVSRANVGMIINRKTWAWLS